MRTNDSSSATDEELSSVSVHYRITRKDLPHPIR